MKSQPHMRPLAGGLTFWAAGRQVNVRRGQARPSHTRIPPLPQAGGGVLLVKTPPGLSLADARSPLQNFVGGKRWLTAGRISTVGSSHVNPSWPPSSNTEGEGRHEGRWRPDETSAGRLIGEPNSFEEGRAGLARREPLVVGVAAVPTDKGQPASLAAGGTRCRFHTRPLPSIHRGAVSIPGRWTEAAGREVAFSPRSHSPPARQADRGNSRARLGRRTGTGPKGLSFF